MSTEKFIEVAKFTIPNKICYNNGKDKAWMQNEIRKEIPIRRRTPGIQICFTCQHRKARKIIIRDHQITST